jgi:hypothetical protein
MTQETATRTTKGKSDGPGQESITVYKNNTTAWCRRQLVKVALPYIAAIVTSTRFTARKSCFLDRLIIMAEGGEHDI